MDGNHPTTDESTRTTQFLRLYSTTQQRLFAYILTMIPTWHDAEEVLQETSMVLWKAFDQYQPNTNFWAWASTTAFHQVLSFRKRTKRLAIPLDDKFIEAASAEFKTSINNLDDKLAALPRCVEKLPPDERELLTACYQPNVTIHQIAEQIGRPAGTVYKSLTRIRRTLLKCINGVLSEGGRP